MRSLFLLLVFTTLMGCSYRGSYESVQVYNRSQCTKLPPSQYDECMERANVPYDDYERKRQESLRR